MTEKAFGTFSSISSKEPPIRMCKCCSIKHLEKLLSETQVPFDDVLAVINLNRPGKFRFFTLISKKNSRLLNW